MSSLIRLCPSCQLVGQVVYLPVEQMDKLVGKDAVAHMRREGWSGELYWCPKCEMLVVQLWPEKVSVEERRELAGIESQSAKNRQKEGTQ